MKKKMIVTVTCLMILLGTVFVAIAQINSDKSQEMFDSNKIKELPPLKNPLIVVKKKERQLFLYDGEELIKTYKIGLGFAPEGDKEIEGDGKTPEGEFYIFTKNAKSNFYLSLGVSYPGVDDAERGLKDKLISKTQRDEIVKAIDEKKMPLQKTPLGGEIYIHGNGSSNDWTWGCVAVDDADMKELFEAIPVGAKIRIER